MRVKQSSFDSELDVAQFGVVDESGVDSRRGIFDVVRVREQKLLIFALFRPTIETQRENVGQHENRAFAFASPENCE